MQRWLVLMVIGLCLPQLLWADPLPNKPHIYVEGNATVEVAPDTMTFTLSLQKIDKELATAKADVDKRSNTLIELCKTLNIAAEDIATTTLRISPVVEYHEGRRVPAGTEVSRRVEITLRDLSQYSQVMAALVKSDVSETVDTRLSVSNEKALSEQVLGKALEDAYQRAQRLAKAQGKKLGQPFSISEFPTRNDDRPMLQVSGSLRAQKSAMAFDSAANAREPFEPGTMETSAQVYVVYYLK